MTEKPVKLLLAITKSNWGGAQRYVYDIAHHFSNDKDFEITVLTGGQGDLVAKLSDINIKTIPLLSLKRDIGIVNDVKSIFELFSIIRKEKPDVLHLNSSKMGLFGALIGRILFVPRIIFTAHAWPFNEMRPRYQRYIFRALGLVTVFLSHKTIAVSRNVITTLRAPKFIAHKMTCIYTGIDVPKLYEAGAFFTERSLTKTPGTHIVSIGELHMSKGLDRALIALAKCKHLPFTYHIMGTGDKKKYLEALTTNLGLSDRVIFHGFVENASLYLNSFDLFLFPSRTEALGYVAIEALFTKLPIIASNAGGIPEVLFDDPYTRLVDCNSEKTLKETLLSMLQKKIVVDETNRPGRMKFLPKFMLTATKKIYIK